MVGQEPCEDDGRLDSRSTPNSCSSSAYLATAAEHGSRVPHVCTVSSVAENEDARRGGAGRSLPSVRRGNEFSVGVQECLLQRLLHNRILLVHVLRAQCSLFSRAFLLWRWRWRVVSIP